MTALRHRISVDVVVETVNDFERRYGPVPLVLATHASVADRLRPRMLGAIRTNFLEGAHRFDASHDADVLFGPLCIPQGGDIYEMHPDIRSYLFKELDRHWPTDTSGRYRSQQVGLMLRHYIASLPSALNDGSKHEEQFRQQNLWRALAIDEPDAAFKQIYQATKERLEQPRDKLKDAPRAAGILSVAQDVLSVFSEDTSFWTAIDHLADGRRDEGIRLLAALENTGFEPGTPDVKSPAMLLEEEEVFSNQRRNSLEEEKEQLEIENETPAEGETKLSNELGIDLDKVVLRDTPITRAVRSGNMDAVRAAVAAHPEGLNQIDRFGYAPLHHALNQKREDIAHFLLHQDADPEVRTARDGTPLIIAGFHGLTEMARVLLEKGADPCAVNSKGSSTLMAAAYYGQREIVKLLLAHPKMNLDHIMLENHEHRFDALHWAVSSGDQVIVDALIERGATVSADFSGRTNLLHCAALSQSREMVLRVLALGYPINQRTAFGWTALHMACYDRPSVDIVELLLECGADPYIATVDGWTPSRLAAHGDNPDILAVLDGYQTYTARHVADAAYAGAIYSLTYLVDQKGVVFAAKTWVDALIKSDKPAAFDFLVERETLFGVDYATLFGKAVEFCKPKILRHIREIGRDLPELPEKKKAWAYVAEANTEKQDATIGELLKFQGPQNVITGGEDYIVTAAGADLTETVEVLLAQNVSLSVRGKGQLTPLGAALSAGHIAMARRLLEAGAEPDAPVGVRGEPPLFWANLPGMKLLQESGANLFAEDFGGATLLHLLARQTNNDAEINFAIEQGLKVDAKDLGGRTPLHVAAIAGFPGTVKRMLEAGATLEAIANTGFTPYLAALDAGRKDVAELLRKAGADRAAKTSGGWSALHIAAEQGDQKRFSSTWREVGRQDKAAQDPPRTALQLAAEVGAADTVKALLASGLSPDSGAGLTPTPLHLAIGVGSFEVAKMLVLAGANVAKADVKSGMDARRAVLSYIARQRRMEKFVPAAELLTTISAHLPKEAVPTTNRPPSAKPVTPPAPPAVNPIPVAPTAPPSVNPVPFAPPPGHVISNQSVFLSGLPGGTQSDNSNTWTRLRGGWLSRMSSEVEALGKDYSGVPLHQYVALTLDFVPGSRLIRIASTKWPQPLQALYFLDDGQERFWLNGATLPKFTHLPTRETVLSYLLFHCFFVQENGQSRLILVNALEEFAAPINGIPNALKKGIGPPKLINVENDGSFICSATVVFDGALTQEVFRVAGTGEISVLDSVVVAKSLTDVPEITRHL